MATAGGRSVIENTWHWGVDYWGKKLGLSACNEKMFCLPWTIFCAKELQLSVSCINLSMDTWSYHYIPLYPDPHQSKTNNLHINISYKVNAKEMTLQSDLNLIPPFINKYLTKRMRKGWSIISLRRFYVAVTNTNF